MPATLGISNLTSHHSILCTSRPTKSSEFVWSFESWIDLEEVDDEEEGEGAVHKHVKDTGMSFPPPL